MKYFDSHAHYYDERFADEIGKSVDSFIDALLEDSVSYIVNVGTSPETSRLAIAQAEKHGNMYTAIGIHPSDTRFLSDIDDELRDIEALIRDPASKCVALGEIGLDYHYDGTDKAKQAEYFIRQMRLAEKMNIPVVIHDREAHGDVMDVIRRFPSVRGVLHSFSGSCEMAEELVSLGYMISFSGTLTFTNARRPREVAAILPRERILIETDCPYLAPHPKRGTLNHSGNLVYTNAKLAELLDITEEECASLTENNARRFFGI
ncbi:MAG: TatD family hydrolase [Clostridia bacterium]|nr:TatD family hydrolase [Clostridia bacterium]